MILSFKVEKVTAVTCTVTVNWLKEPSRATAIRTVPSQKGGIHEVAFGDTNFVFIAREQKTFLSRLRHVTHSWPHNRPFYSYVKYNQASVWKRVQGWLWNDSDQELVSNNDLHMKTKKVYNKVKSTEASLLCKGLVTKHANVKRAIQCSLFYLSCPVSSRWLLTPSAQVAFQVIPVLITCHSPGTRCLSIST